MTSPGLPPISNLTELMSLSLETDLAEHSRRDVYAECLGSPTAFENWVGAVESAGIPMPRSVMIACPKAFTVEIIDKMPLSEESEQFILNVCQAVKAMADETGFPVFVKNSFTSSKSDWDESCSFISAERDHVLKNLSTMAHFLSMGPSPYAGMIVVREMLKTTPAFYAFNGMPITKEFRFFARDGKADSYQPYWPAEAFKDEPTPVNPDWDKIRAEILSKTPTMKHTHMVAQMPQRPPPRLMTIHTEGIEPLRGEYRLESRRWAPEQSPKPRLLTAEQRLEKLAEMNTISDSDLTQLIEHAQAVTRILGGYWSVDFLQDAAGKWWLIDMAEGDLSFVNHKDLIRLS